MKKEAVGWGMENREWRKQAVILNRALRVGLRKGNICCCCCWVASVVSDSVRPHRRQPTGIRHPWDSPGKNTGVGCHFLFQCMRVKVNVLSRVWLFTTPWTAAYQAPPSMGLSRQEYWSGVPWADNKESEGTSLVVQWLRLRLPMQRMQAWSLVRKLRPHMLWGSLQPQSPWAQREPTRELVWHSDGAK